MKLSLAEELLLVAFDPGRGKATSRPALALPFGLAGAVVMDLVQRHGSSLVGGKVAPGLDTGDPTLDDALGRIRSDAKPRDVKHWVKKLAGRSVNLQNRLLEQLVAKRVLEDREGHVLGLKVRRHTLIGRVARDAVLAEVHDALAFDTPIDAHAAALSALVNAVGVVDRAVAKPELTRARRRAKELQRADVAGKAVSSAVEEIEAAVMAGVIAAVAASSVTASGHGH